MYKSLIFMLHCATPNDIFSAGLTQVTLINAHDYLFTEPHFTEQKLRVICTVYVLSPLTCA